MSRMLPRDGYSLPGVFPASPLQGIPAMKFTFRYADPKDVFDFQLRQNRAGNGEEMIAAIRDLIFPKGEANAQPRIAEWDVEEEFSEGGTFKWRQAACNAENLGRLPVPVQNFIANCVCRYAIGKQEEGDIKK